MVLSNLHCVFDRAELSVTCSKLHGAVHAAPPPPPLPAFRAYFDKLTNLDVSLDRLEIRNWSELIRIKKLVSKDLKRMKNKETIEPLFLELVLKWVEVTEPSDDVIESLWKSVAYSESRFLGCSASMMRMFCNLIDNTSERLNLGEPPNHDHTSYSNAVHNIVINQPLELFQRVNNIGHAVLTLPFSRPEFHKCVEIMPHPPVFQFYTLALESGYYVIRNSTLEECHGQCICDCQDKKMCPLNGHINKKAPVLFYLVFATLFESDDFDITIRRKSQHLSLFLNTKKGVDEAINTISSGAGVNYINLFHLHNQIFLRVMYKLPV